MKKKWIPKKQKIVSFRIPDEMNSKLEFQSYQMKISTSDIIRKALEIFLSGSQINTNHCNIIK